LNDEIENKPKFYKKAKKKNQKSKIKRIKIKVEISINPNDNFKILHGQHKF
jgi:hypothetical protein